MDGSGTHSHTGNHGGLNGTNQPACGIIGAAGIIVVSVSGLCRPAEIVVAKARGVVVAVCAAGFPAFRVVSVALKRVVGVGGVGQQANRVINELGDVAERVLRLRLFADAVVSNRIGVVQGTNGHGLAVCRVVLPLGQHRASGAGFGFGESVSEASAQRGLRALPWEREAAGARGGGWWLAWSA